MLYRRTARLVVLVLCILIPSRASAQSTERRPEGSGRRGTLGQNQPNPFPRETKIPFTVGGDSCGPGTEQHVVTLRIYNILSQLIGIPVLVDSSTADDSASAATRRSLDRLTLPCGAYSAYWDGTHAHGGRLAAPGVYMYQLVVDGHPAGMKKLLVAR
jgi:hypothetical protein